jgi:hypothetical protein
MGITVGMLLDIPGRTPNGLGGPAKAEFLANRNVLRSGASRLLLLKINVLADRLTFVARVLEEGWTEGAEAA